MATPANDSGVRFDAPFWALAIIVVISLASLGCFGIAAVQTTFHIDAAIISTDQILPPADL